MILLTVEVAGFMAGRLANGDNITDRGLIFALDKVLHDLGNLFHWLRRPDLRRLDEYISSSPLRV